MKSLQILPDSFLLEAYQDAIRLNLSSDFIDILYQEINQRNILM